MNISLFADRRACGVAAVLLLAAGRPAWADLNKVPGLTVVQAPVAAAIQKVCPALGGLVDRQAATAQQIQLFSACGKMVQTSNVQQGGKDSSLNLGLDEAQLGAALQGIAPEELSAQGYRAMSGSRNAVNGRLLALRGGAHGFLVSSNRSGNESAATGLAHGPADSPRGGAAGSTPLAGPWGGFVNANYNQGDRDRTDYENAYDFRNAGVTVGADYRVTERLVFGGAVSRDSSSSDFEAATGNVEARANGLMLYGSYNANAAYVEGHLSHSRIDYDSERRIVVSSLTPVAGINTSARGGTQGTQNTAALGTGYEAKFGKSTLIPFLRVEYLRNDIDAFTETEDSSSLGFDVMEQSVESLQSSLGLRYSFTHSAPAGVWVPYVGLEWSHEFRNDSRNIVAKYTHDPFNNFFAIPTQKPDRDFATLSLGVSAQFPGGLSGFVNLDSVQGLRDTSNTGLTLGLRQEF